MDIFGALDMLCDQLSKIWVWLNTPTYTLMFGSLTPNIFPLLFPKDVIEMIAPTPLSAFISTFVITLTVVFVFRFIRLLNPLA